MASYMVTAPDGKRYKINAPEGVGEAEALEYFKGQYSSTQGGATPTEANPAGPRPPQGAESSGFIDDTLDVVQEFGSGMGRTLAKGMDFATTPQRTILGNMGRMTGILDEDTNVDITDSTDEVLSGGQMDPGTARDMVSGAGELVPEVAALAAPVGLTGALAARGAKALGMGGKGLNAARAASAAGKPQGLLKTTGKILKGVGTGAVEGAVIDLALGDDLDPVQGAKAGASLFAFKEFLTNTPAGRSMWLKMARKLGGGKMTEAMWQMQNPRNQQVIKDMFSAIFKRGAK